MKKSNVIVDMNRSTLGKLLLVYLSLLIVFLFSSLAKANYECSLVRQLYERLSCYNGAPLPGGATGEAEALRDNQFVLTSDFGPSVCKAKGVLAEVRKELKGECESWMKERKGDLGVNYMTGTCEEKQEACNGGLVKLSVKGLVHYKNQAMSK